MSRMHDGRRPRAGFAELSSGFSQPAMKYAPFSWLVAYRHLKKEDAGTLRMLAAEAVKQRVNPGYLFLLPNEDNRPCNIPEAFLSAEYMDVFGAALEVAAESGTALSYCDEWDFPCGKAGGNMLLQHPELRAEILRCRTREIKGGGTVSLDKCFFCVAALCEEKEKDSQQGPSPVLSSTLTVVSRGEERQWRAPQGCWRLYVFNKETVAQPERWGHSENINYLDRRLADCVIELAQQPYEKRFGEHFGKAIPGFFMDHEGDFGWKLPWSEDLERDYRADKGRDIRLWMPLLLEKDAEGLWAKARWDWYDVVSRLYSGQFARISDWAAERGMYNTVHFWDESLLMEAHRVGSHFRALRAVTMPGIDALRDACLWVRYFKEAQSVSEFEGRRFMCEAHAVYGWHLSPTTIKKTANCMAAWGVSHVIPFGTVVTRESIKANRPHDLLCMPYWRWLHNWNDFVRRTSYINSHGRLAADVLLYHPMDSVWAAMGGTIFDADNSDPMAFLTGYGQHRALTGEEGTKHTDNPEYLDGVEEAYTELIRDLDEMQVEFLIADSDYLEEMSVTPDGRLKKGDYGFGAVVLPPLLILPLSLAEKLLLFARKGGEVYILGRPPAGSVEYGLTPSQRPGDRDREMAEIMNLLLALPSVHLVEGSIAPWCRSDTGLAPQVEFLEGDFKLLTQHRAIDGRDLYWLANNSGREQKSRLLFRGAGGAVSIWDCEGGSIRAAASQDTADGAVLELSFGPYEGFWVVFDRGLPAGPDMPAAGQGRCLLELEGPWKINIDPQDQPHEPYPGFVMEIPEQLLPENGGLMDSLKTWREWGLEEFDGLVGYEMDFVLDEKPLSLKLSLGRLSHAAEVFVNGETVGSRLWPPFDFDITAAARQGENSMKVVVGSLRCNRPPSPSEGGEGPEDFQTGLLGPVKIISEV